MVLKCAFTVEVMELHPSTVTKELGSPRWAAIL
jgi:hypothetical protein